MDVTTIKIQSQPCVAAGKSCGLRRVFYELKTKWKGIDYPIKFYHSFARLTSALLIFILPQLQSAIVKIFRQVIFFLLEEGSIFMDSLYLATVLLAISMPSSPSICEMA